MTITEKIFARASGREVVKPGEIVEAKIDYAMMPDGVGGGALRNLDRLGIDKVWDKDRVIIVIDHVSPPSSVGGGNLVAGVTRSVEKFGLPHFYNMQGVSHQVMPEDGFVVPGAFIVGGDSHTVTYGALGAFSTGLGGTEMTWVSAMGSLWFRAPETIRVEVSGKLGPMVMGKDIILKVLQEIGPDGATYKALEFGGAAIRELSIDGRLTICNMSVEVGAKNGIIETDEKTYAYLEGRARDPVTEWRSDPDCNYSLTLNIDGDKLEPLVAKPHNPGNVVTVGELEGTKVDQVLLGSCTGGRMEDYRIAASIMKGTKVPKRLRCIVMPASPKVQMDMTKEGLTEIFLESGCVVTNPQCGPCGGVQMGFLGDGEACIGTHNRNFMGRMGSPEASIYLSSPAVAAAAALTGYITDPRKLNS